VRGVALANGGRVALGDDGRGLDVRALVRGIDHLDGVGPAVQETDEPLHVLLAEGRGQHEADHVVALAPAVAVRAEDREQGHVRIIAVAAELDLAASLHLEQAHDLGASDGDGRHERDVQDLALADRQVSACLGLEHGLANMADVGHHPPPCRCWSIQQTIQHIT
jgi:hypothetical protein